MEKTQKAILKTLAYFAIFGRPLVLDEIWHYLYRVKTSRLQVLIGLRNLQKKKLVVKKDKYFFLRGHQKNLADFKRKQKICRKRWQKVNWITKVLKYVPFTKNISVINSLSFGVADESSDIDILIITKKDRLWTVRALTILVLEVLGQNKNKWYKAGKFCLGFAFDESRLSLEKLKISPPAGKDIHFTYWLVQSEPVYDQKIYLELIKHNPWIFEDLPNWEAKIPKKETFKKSILEKFLLSKFGSWLEEYLSNIQIKRIWTDPENWRKGASVVADSHMLKLHAYDKRDQYRQQWEDLTKSIIFK